MLAAGLKGIEDKVSLPSPIGDNVFEMSEKDRISRGITTLPGSLLEAVQLTERSDLVRKALGEHVFTSFIENKKIEWDQWRIQITDYELKRYLPVL
jgi:glutamine synthetase